MEYCHWAGGLIRVVPFFSLLLEFLRPLFFGFLIHDSLSLCLYLLKLDSNNGKERKVISMPMYARFSNSSC